MNRALVLFFVFVCSPLVAVAADPGSFTTRGERLGVHVGEETAIPLDGATGVFLGDVELAKLEAKAPYLRIRGVKAGETTLVIRTASGRKVTHQLSVR